MKVMGKAECILGVNIKRDQSKILIALFQELYKKKVLEQFNMLNCKSVSRPIAKVESLTLNICPKTKEKNNKCSKFYIQVQYGI